MRRPAATVIDFISAIPGLGKTHWSIAQMCRDLTANERSLYVAPTIRLLEQVKKDLKPRLSKADFKKVFMFHHQNCRDVPLQVRNKLCDRATREGRIVLTTHDSFLKLRYSSEFKNVIVYFDEARKVVMRGAQIVLDDVTAQDLFAQLFELAPRSGDSKFRQVTCRPGTDQRLRESASFSDSPQFVRQYKRIKQLFEKASNPRYEVFLNIPESADEIIDSGQSFLMKQHRFYEIIMPSHIFDGFKRVTVLAAHFEDSQMFHLLKESPGIQLKDISYNLGDSWRKRGTDLLHRYYSVTIALLTPQYRALSMNQLSTGLLAPARDIDGILSKVGSVSWVREALKAKTISTSYKLPKDQERVIRYLKSLDTVEFDPMQWYIKSAKRVIRHWKRKHKVFGLPLMVLNKQFAKDERYVDLLNDENGMPEAEILPLMNHGLNAYMERNVLAFLAAINPDPQMIQFYQERLPHYNFSKDHVADVCIQSAGRLSLRDTNSRDKVLVVVSDHYIAQLLYEKMSNRAAIVTDYTTRLGSMVVVNNDYENRYTPEEAKIYRDQARSVASEKKQKARSGKEKAKRKASPYVSRLASINSGLTRRRRRAEAGDKEAQAQVRALEKERDTLKELKAKYPERDEKQLVALAKRKAQK